MKKELQDKLFNKYPNLFVQKDLPMSQTCMCWGIETPSSWYGVMDKVCEKIQNHVDKSGIKQVEFSQVKEKFGLLRIYYDNGDDKIDKFIDEAEYETTKICAVCGSFEEVKPTRGWISYLCKKCRHEK